MWLIYWTALPLEWRPCLNTALQCSSNSMLQALELSMFHISFSLSLLCGKCTSLKCSKCIILSSRIAETLLIYMNLYHDEIMNMAVVCLSGLYLCLNKIDQKCAESKIDVKILVLSCGISDCSGRKDVWHAQIFSDYPGIESPFYQSRRPFCRDSYPCCEWVVPSGTLL